MFFMASSVLIFSLESISSVCFLTPEFAIIKSLNGDFIFFKLLLTPVSKKIVLPFDIEY